MTDGAAAADVLVSRLADLGVDQIFGYPGGQLTPVYDALYRLKRVRHRLARDEQAAAFMADGYARSTGRTGVCLAVCGPGVYNATTALATAFSDSIPVLLLTGQIPSSARGLRSGYYHENDQRAVCATLTKQQFRIDRPEDVVRVVDQAWQAARSGRPGPVLLEIPIDVSRGEVPAGPWPARPEPPVPPAPKPAEVEALARLMAGWKRPLLLAGGGVISAGAERLLGQLAGRLGAPVLHTAMGKCSLPASHPLAFGMPWRRASSDLTGMEAHFSPLWAEADGLLAIGCRFTQLATGSWVLKPPASLAHIDIDPEELGRHYPLTQGICADAASTLTALLHALPPAPRPPWARPISPGEPWHLPGLDLLPALRRQLPADAILSADVTRLTYILMAGFPLEQPRTFLHPAGSVAMGYGIPAALGAKAAWPGRKVIVVVGDGGFLMSGMELATAVQEQLPIIVILVNDNRLTLIQATQERRYGQRYIGVDLRNPDFSQLAGSFGVSYARADSDREFEANLARAVAGEEPALLEVRPADARG